MKRVNISLTDKQIERLHQREEKEGISLAEWARRAIDTFLAWDDPTYLHPTAQAASTAERPFIPALK